MDKKHSRKLEDVWQPSSQQKPASTNIITAVAV